MSKTLSLISQVHNLCDRMVAGLLRQHPQTPVNAAQMRLLMSLWDQDGINVQEMADRNCLKKNTLSTMLPRMVEAGLIELNPDLSDHRARIVTLTSKANELRLQHQQLDKLLEDQLLAGVNAPERAVFLKVLEQLKENLLHREMESHNDRKK